MGIDYCADSGVEMKVATFLEKVVTNKTKAQEKRIIDACKQAIDDEEGLPQVEINTWVDVKEFLNTVLETTGEAGKYEGDMQFSYFSCNEPYCMITLFAYLGATMKLPSPKTVRIFDSYRQHSEMTVGEAVIIYDEDDMWKKVPTNVSKKICKILGVTSLYVPSWTDVG